MKRTFVIGDIHGGLLALKQVLSKVSINQSDKLIFLGDYVDGWSESAQVIDYLIDLEAECECIFIKGNHDSWCEDWLMGKLANETWLFHGGKSTVKSYQNYSPDQKQKHLAFFNRMKNFYVDSENRLFIHAGFSSMHGPEKEHYESNYSWDRTLWEMALTMDKHVKKDSVFYPKRLKLFHEIYIGHTPTLYYDVSTPMNAINVWNIDTGAAFKGSLSILEIHSKEFWQSEPVYTLYPHEKGRN
ncbi:metallophosphatase [Emticicia aquatilis]|uniref:Metallophosphatase n=1 Tax=Emticicia aquatilis TaxID=1537369 RepID=A0A916ZBM3_9BACT|nr:metallophosphoesterase family protein [Emticicia aquatilis]GGD84036.1 metallophosphatase [Emticicia aquatilis]